MSDAVRKIFDDISPTYDRLNHLLSFNIDKTWRRKTMQKIAHHPSFALQVLDICAGTHDLGLACLQKFPHAQIAAIDFSQEMLKVGQEKLNKLGVTAIKPQWGDALHLPYADNSFDVVMCAYGVRNFDDPKKGMQEMLRVLKPGGQVLILEFFRPTKAAAKFFNKTYAEFILPALGRLVSGHKSAYRYLKDSIRGFSSIVEFKTLLENLGFNDVQQQNFLFAIASVVSAKK